MILAITNTVRPACLAQLRATKIWAINGRDGAECNWLVTARLVSAPSRPYPNWREARRMTSQVTSSKSDVS
jgi:hypothetical protein